MEVKILLGKDNFDFNDTRTQFQIYDELKKLGVKVKFVFPSEQALMDFAEFHKKAPNELYAQNWQGLPKEDKVVSPNTFKQNNVYITPLYLFSYLDIQKNKSFNQVIGGGYEKIDDIRDKIKNALILFKVSKPSDFNTQKNATTPLNYNLEYLDKNNPKTEEFKKFIEEKIQKTKNGGGDKK